MRRRLLLVLLLLATACAPALAGRSARGDERSAPMRGQVVFESHCAGCHPGGNGGLGPALDRPVTHALLKMQVRRGVGMMPAFDEEQIADPDFEALAAYLRALRAARFARR